MNNNITDTNEIDDGLATEAIYMTTNNIERDRLNDLVVASLWEGDKGAAILFTELFRGRVLRDASLEKGQGSWNVFSGHRWVRTNANVIRAAAMPVMAGLYANVRDIFQRELKELTELLQSTAKDGSSDEERKALLDAASHTAELLESAKKRFNAMNSSRQTMDMLNVVAGVNGMHTGGDKWDQNPNLLGVLNGVIEFHDKTFTFRAGKPGDMIRTVSAVEYNKDATRERFEKMIFDMFDGHAECDLVISFLKRFFGTCLTGHIHKKILILYGANGNNGKTKLLELLKLILGGDIAAPVEKSLLMKTGSEHSASSANPALYALMGRRLVWTTETNQGDRIDTGVVKKLTGGDTITTRRIYGDQISFDATYKVVLLTNNRPEIIASDQATWNRVALLEIPNCFVQNPTAPNERKLVADIDKLIASTEGSGVLNWLLEGYCEWRALGDLNIPASISAATEEYRRDMNKIAMWIDARGHVVSSTKKSRAEDAFTDFKEWQRNEMESHPMSQTEFSNAMKQNGYRRVRSARGFDYHGIELANAVAPSTLTDVDHLNVAMAAAAKADFATARASADRILLEETRNIVKELLTFKEMQTKQASIFDFEKSVNAMNGRLVA